MKVAQTQNILTSLYHVSRDTCTVHGRGIKTRVFCIDIDLAIKEGLVFYQTRSNAIILQGTLPAYCIVKVERLRTGEKLYERRYLSLRPPPKISLNTITVGLKEMINRVLELNFSQLENSFNSHLEKQFNLVLPSQPNPLNPLKIERRNL